MPETGVLERPEPAPPESPAAAVRHRGRRWPTWGQVGFWLAVLIVLAVSLFPFYWIVRTSLETSAEFSNGTTSLLPSHLTFSNYTQAFTQADFARPLLNSAIVALATTAISVVFGSLAGYALARLRIPSGPILAFILAAAFFPVLAMVGPLFLLYRHLGFLDSIYPLVLTYLVYTLPIATWLLKNFFAQIPPDLEEAALVDGATRLKALWRVVVPVAVPGVFTAAILSFILAWNDFAFALSFLQTPSKFTAPLAIVNLGQTQNAFQVMYNRIDAAVVIVTVPIALLVLFAQRRIVSGLTAGALR
jgi:ABC-type glycerol-3-phosphate transport system permease component